MFVLISGHLAFLRDTKDTKLLLRSHCFLGFMAQAKHSNFSNEMDTNKAQKRLRDEVTHALDTSTLIPRVHPLFKIINVDKINK